MKKEIKSWSRISQKLLQKTFAFDLYVHRMRSPDTSQCFEDDFFVMETSDWVNIIPLTAKQEVVLVRQYRFGIEKPSLEIPGGRMDRVGESPQDAAVRELEEETSFIPDQVIPLGTVHPNPALQTNRCFTFLAEGVHPKGQNNLDPAEDISVELLPLKQIPGLIAQGEITHALVVAAFFHFFARFPECLLQADVMSQ